MQGVITGEVSRLSFTIKIRNQDATADESSFSRRMPQKETPGCELMLAIGKPLEICPKNEAGSRVLFGDQIETRAIMRL